MSTDFLDQRVLAAMLVSVQLIVAYIAIIWLALVFWTYRDSRRRTRDKFLQAFSVLTTLLFFVPGYWVYLLVRPPQTLSERQEESLREALVADYGRTSKCPYCRERVREDFLVCPSCNYTLRESCRGCSHAIQPGWSVCPFCRLSTAEPQVIAARSIGAEPYLEAVGR